MIIVLMGYMGSGKSTVGQIVAKKLNCKFRDLDDIIAENEGQTIPQLFDSKGEIYFRKKETEYLNKVLNSETNMVLALGGGTPCYANNMSSILTSEAKSIFLRTSIASLFNRLKVERENRPMISHLTSDEELMEFIGKHLFERQAYYNQAQFIVTTDKKSTVQISEEIIDLLKN